MIMGRVLFYCPPQATHDNAQQPRVLSVGTIKEEEEEEGMQAYAVWRLRGSYDRYTGIDCVLLLLSD